MLQDNLKTLRKARGLTQEELAIRLNVVRQTVSKWEKGLSVPDAEMLVKLADILESSVVELLGTKIEEEHPIDPIAEQLSRINEQLAVRNRRARRVWQTVGIVFGALVLLTVLLVTVAYISLRTVRVHTGADQTLPEEVTQYRSVCQIYRNPANHSFSSGDNGLIYSVAVGYFGISERETGKILYACSQSIYDPWQIFPYAEGKWEEVCPGFEEQVGLSRYEERLYQPLAGSYFLLKMDGHLWVAEMSGGKVWTIFEIMPEDAV